MVSNGSNCVSCSDSSCGTIWDYRGATVLLFCRGPCFVGDHDLYTYIVSLPAFLTLDAVCSLYNSAALAQSQSVK